MTYLDTSYSGFEIETSYNSLLLSETHDLPDLPGCVAFLRRTPLFSNSLDYLVSKTQIQGL